MGLFTLGSLRPPVTATAQQDPLPSWNDGPAKRAIMAFVAQVTTPGAGFVPVEQRVATVDNDGTLWQEQPTAELVFALTRLRTLARQDSTWRTRQPVKAALEGDHEWLHHAGEQAVLELLGVTHGNISQEQFEADARAFLDTARHPKLGRSYVELTYGPMHELLALLKENDFQVWISSGGTLEFMRVFAPRVYRIPPSRVIGSVLKREARVRDGRMTLWRTRTVESVNDKEGKVVNIDRIIGQRPILVAGNVGSAGDVAMMHYSRGRAGPSLQLLVVHDDAQREFTYQERDTASIRAARAFGFTLVSMARDWKVVFGAP